MRNAKKDDNHNKIKENLIRCGFSVADTHMVGNNFPDMVVAKCGVTALVEVKSDSGELTKGQDKFKTLWQGKYIVARNYIQVLKMFDIDVI